jgi:hypothetical protein
VQQSRHDHHESSCAPENREYGRGEPWKVGKCVSSKISDHLDGYSKKGVIKPLEPVPCQLNFDFYSYAKLWITRAKKAKMARVGYNKEHKDMLFGSAS